MRKITCLLLLCLSFSFVQAQETDSLNLTALYHWDDPDMIGSFFFDNAYNEIWGYSKDGREYAIIGTTDGTHIFDVTDPANSSEIHFIEGALTGGNVIHRDYHDYEDYLYIVCDEGASTLQIVDLSGLPDEISLEYDSDELFSRSHNIFIDEANGMMYSCGGNFQLALFSLEDPLNPTLALNCADEIINWSGTIGYIHDIYVKDGIAYCNAGPNGLFVYDFSDLENPVFLGSLTDYEESGYNHSGWLHENGEIYALADETHGTRIKILDVSDPSDIQILSLIGSEITDNSIVHNLIFVGDLLHVSYYYDGYYIFDISDPENPETIAFYDTSTEINLNSYKGAWGVYPFFESGSLLVSDMQTGLWVFEYDETLSIEEPSQNSAFSIYPNPVLEDQWLSLNGIPQTGNNWTFKIHDVQGKLALEGILRPEDKSKIFLSTLPHGLYSLTLSNGLDQLQTKFIK